MYGFTLFSSNRLERLALKLAMRIGQRPDDPFIPETIVVQSRGMERWLALEIANLSGVAANLQFPFPETLIRTILKAVLPGMSDASAFRRDAMLFGIFESLPSCMDTDPAFEPLKSYLRKDDSGVKRLQLAQRIAYLYDQYQVFRPEMVLAWDEGSGTGDGHHRWQAALWREITRRLPGIHRARLWQQLIEALESGIPRPDGVPHRVSIFGISYLPPFYLHVFLALSRVMTVDFYQLNPCRQYWADIVSRGEEKRIERAWREPLPRLAQGDLHLEEGNRLLASMGRQGRTFHRLTGDFDWQAEDDFEEGRGDTLLTLIQADILNLRTGMEKNEAAPKIMDTDRSLQIHACHSPMREIEVLYDQVLDMLNMDADLHLRDILVLTPDIDTYAPYIQAVFGTPEDEAHRMAYSIADRKPVQGHPLVEAFVSLLDINQSRFPASEVVTLLEVPAVREAFELSEEDVPLVGQWISSTRIRWGVDAASKSRWGLPPNAENTWQAGLDRLILGYAFAPESPELFKSLMPARGAEGTKAESLGRLVHLVESLRSWQEQSGQPRRLEEWSAQMMQVLDVFFRPRSEIPGDVNDLEMLRRLIADMRRHSATARANAPVGVEVVRDYLKRRLEEERSGGGFISGGITFAALLPMRSIPAKVVCLLGMNQDLFPREDRPLGFDLMAAKPRLGDRSRRDDDKYLFLEALISARQTFYLSYVGHDVQDNACLPPSVLVSELVDYIGEAYDRCEKDLIVHHPLQAFSEAYFSGENPQLFSYSRQACDAAHSLARSGRTPSADQAFVTTPLAVWAARFLTVDIPTLVGALGHPCRFLLEKRLGVKLYDQRVSENDRESFRLDPLERFVLGQDMMQRLISHPAGQDLLDIARAEGRLPHGEPGNISFDDIYGEAEALAAAVRDVQEGTSLVVLPIEERLDAFTITGVLDTLFPAGQLCYRYANTRGVDLIDAWLRHLLWCRRSDDAAACVTMIFNKDGRRRFAPVDDAQVYLKQLLTLYRQAGHEPLPLFPKASWQYAVLRYENGRSREEALDRVRSRWRQTYAMPSEAEDPYIQYCFGGEEALGERFAALTEDLFGPIMEYSESI